MNQMIVKPSIFILIILQLEIIINNFATKVLQDMRSFFFCRGNIYMDMRNISKRKKSTTSFKT